MCCIIQENDLGSRVLNRRLARFTQREAYVCYDKKDLLKAIMTYQFVPDIEYWLQPTSTYRVVFIQVSASQTETLITALIPTPAT